MDPEMLIIGSFRLKCMIVFTDINPNLDCPDVAADLQALGHFQ
jgi:hypothetical protein